MKNSLRIHKWTHNEFNIFILGVLTRPPFSYAISQQNVKNHLQITDFFSLRPGNIGLATCQ